MTVDPENRYAEAMEGVEVFVGFRDEAGDDDWQSGTLDSDGRRTLARAVMAVADEERAADRAEIERLRGTLEAANDAVAEAATERAEAAEAEVERLRGESKELRADVDRLWAYHDAVVEYGERADAAEARLDALVVDLWELVGEWRAEAERLREFADKHQGYYLGVVGTRRNCRDHLHAVLDKHAGEQPQGGEGW